MKFSFHLLFPAAAVIFMLIFSMGCKDDSDNGRYIIDLAGTWKIIDTDTDRAASPSFDDSKSPDLAIPGDWLNILKRNDELSATVWIRKKIFISAGSPLQQPVLFIERIGFADETYFNGVKIGMSGVIPDTPGDLHYQISWHVPRRYFIPGSIVKYGADNIIAIRVYSHIQSGIKGKVLIEDYQHGYFSQIFTAYKPLFVIVASVVLNMMLILIFTLLYLSEKSKIEYLHFTFVIVCTLLCSFMTFNLPLQIDGLLRHKIGLFLYTLTNFFVLMGVIKFIGYKSRPLVIVSAGMLIIAEACILLAPFSKMLVFYLSYVYLPIANLYVLTAAALFIYAIWKDPRRYWYFLFLVVPVPISMLRNSLILLSYRFNELPLVIFMHVPLVFMSIALYYIYNFEKSRKEKDHLYTALLKKSQNNIRLIQSLKNENKKAEPRNMITNVIEYLDVHYAEKYDRVELAKKFGLNEDYMGQIFRKTAGTNISNYINTNRIQAAKELLEDTGAKIIDIAYNVGFDNLTHFHRQFKQHTGVTPNEYRNIKKKEINET